MSRRMFLIRSTVVAAAGAGLATVPGLAGLLGSAESEAPALDGQAGAAGAEMDAGVTSADGPVVAHVRDASTGEVGILRGTTEVVVRDPGLVARLIRASNS